MTLLDSRDPVPPRDPRRTVAFVVPLYNEEDVVPLLVREIEAYRREHPEVAQVILVDDGSRDGTAALARELTAGRDGYLLLSFSRNFGHQLAVTAGMACVEADAAVVMDADLQDPLWVVTEMIERWRAGYDVVYGIRRQREGETLFKRSATRLFYRLFRRLTDIDAPLDAGDFRLVSRPVLDAYQQLQEQQPYVRGLISWLGFNQTGVEYVRPARAAGTTKYPFSKLLRLALDGLFSFSDKPLRYAVRLGLLVSAGSVLGLLWVLVQKFIVGVDVTGWASVIFALFFFGGLQLFFLGIVGAYLARVYEEVKNRPRYVVRERWRSDAAVPSPSEIESTTTR
ncbi:MAG: glycosyltransferase family 2 protein [Rhodothermales bacterium]|nr:glycosyltransferase family 2 protein [Rhodothermales bacterium]